MKIVIIDSRNGGTRLTDEAKNATAFANIVLHIEQDDVVRVLVPEDPTNKSHHGTLFYAQTEAESSAAKATKDHHERLGKPRSEHNREAALAKGLAVWDMMDEDGETYEEAE